MRSAHFIIEGNPGRSSGMFREMTGDRSGTSLAPQAHALADRRAQWRADPRHRVQAPAVTAAGRRCPPAGGRLIVHANRRGGTRNGAAGGRPHFRCRNADALLTSSQNFITTRVDQARATQTALHRSGSSQAALALEMALTKAGAARAARRAQSAGARVARCGGDREDRRRLFVRTRRRSGCASSESEAVRRLSGCLTLIFAMAACRDDSNPNRDTPSDTIAPIGAGTELLLTRERLALIDGWVRASMARTGPCQPRSTRCSRPKWRLRATCPSIAFCVTAGEGESRRADTDVSNIQSCARWEPMVRRDDGRHHRAWGLSSPQIAVKSGHSA